MGYGAQILADSMSPDGVRLTTFEVEIPRIVLAEFNTHRRFSRNSASSRAIPVKMMIKRVMEDPYIPEVWGSNKPGMQAGDELDEWSRSACLDEWLLARDGAVNRVHTLLKLGLHKQITNRLLEPFLWHTVIVTATEWDNFFHLRNNAMAHPAIATPAAMMQELYEELEPKELKHGEWHLPLVQDVERFNASRRMAEGRGPIQERIDEEVQTLIKLSVGRCARVSYLTHDGKRDPQADIDLHDKLLNGGHMSPFEHVSRPATLKDKDIAVARWKDSQPEGHVGPAGMWFGNFRGWVQYRKLIPHEHDILGRPLDPEPLVNADGRLADDVVLTPDHPEMRNK